MVGQCYKSHSLFGDAGQHTYKHTLSTLHLLMAIRLLLRMVGGTHMKDELFERYAEDHLLVVRM